MTEPLSNTSNHQRLDEMLIHLTPKGAGVPYSLAYDSLGNVLVAAKAGLFKLDPSGTTVLWEKKNIFPKAMAPYCQVTVIPDDDRVVHVQCDDKSALTEFRIYDSEGEVVHEQFIDGKIQSLAINGKGDIFLTKQPPLGSDEFFIYKSTLDCPIDWQEFISDDDFAYQSICCLDDSTLAAALCAVPNNMYSKQCIALIDTDTAKETKRFSTAGRKDGEVYFPRAIQAYEGGVLVLDKTGRFQLFSREGDLLGEKARIDAYLGNGFVVRGDEAVIACSGIVMDRKGETVCDDWIEKIRLDGSFWTPKA